MLFTQWQRRVVELSAATRGVAQVATQGIQEGVRRTSEVSAFLTLSFLQGQCVLENKTEMYMRLD